jgi:hypothetical protein
VKTGASLLDRLLLLVQSSIRAAVRWQLGIQAEAQASDHVFAAEPENRIAREERGGGKTSVVGSPM